MKKLLLFTLLINILSSQMKSQCTFGSFPPSFTINPGFTSGLWFAKKYTLASTATLTGLGLNTSTNPGVNPFRMAIYTDASSQPANLISATAQSTLLTGLNVLSISVPTVIPAGTYWIVAIYGNPSTPTSASLSSTPFLYQSGSLTTPPLNASTWTVGSNYNIDYWAIINTPLISISGSTNVCTGSAVTLTASGANTYTWSTNVSNSTVTLTPLTTTNYTVLGTSQAGCPGLSSITISVNPSPTLSVAGITSVCAGTTLTQTVTGATTYTWSSGATTNTVALAPSSNTVYSVNGTATNGCIGTASIFITAMPLPLLSISGTTAVCIGSSLSQTVSGALSYSWSSGVNSNTILLSPATNTVYSVSGTDINGCVGMVSESITVNPLPAISFTLSNTTLCAGGNGTINVSGVNTCTWNSGPTGLALAINPTVTTTYTVTGTDANNCINTATVSQIVAQCDGIVTQTRNEIRASIFPNPGNGIFELKINGINETTSFQIFSYNGMLLKNESLNSELTTLDLSSYPNGLYYVLVRSNTNQSVIKLIKE